MIIGLEVTAAVRQRGGIGRYVRELLRALAALDNENQYRLFYASTNDDTHMLPELPSNFRTCRLPFHDIWLARMWQRMRVPIPVELITGRVDVYHSPDFTLPPTLPRTPTLLTVHDLSFVRHPRSAAPGLRDYLNLVVPRSVRHATHVLADSESTKEDLMSIYKTPEKKITVLYAGVAAGFKPPEDARELADVRVLYGLGEQPYVLSIGTLQPRKNHARLIEAFDCALRDSEYNLVLAGDQGWQYEGARAQIEERGLHRRVLFPGFVAEKHLQALYSAAKVMAFPSLYEGFGLPVLEAMACGVPVLASNSPCLPEVAGDAALMVDPRNVRAMAAGITELVYNSELRESLRVKGLERATKFCWENSAAELLRIYHALGEHPRVH